MRLKQYLQKSLSDSLKLLETCVAQTKEAQKVLEQLNMQNATYVVHLHSYWVHEGEIPTVTEHTGSLEHAVQKAEQEFKSVNKRSKVQASYMVEVKLGDRGFGVPEPYWKQYAGCSS